MNASTMSGLLACSAAIWGPTSVLPGIERCVELRDDETIGYAGRAAVIPYLGGLYAQIGLFSRARKLIDEAERIYEELGAATAVIHCGTVRADVELLAGDLDAAERTLRVGSVGRILRLHWTEARVVLILAGDEEARFPWQKITHPNMRLWIMSPRKNRNYPEGTRFLGSGFPFLDDGL